MEELTKYELARIIGARALQLASGAPPLVKVPAGSGFIEVAQLELDKGVMSLVVLRTEAKN